MKHERAELYCHTRPTVVRCRLTVRPFLGGEQPAQTRLPTTLNRPSLIISSQKIPINSGHSPVRKGSSRWQSHAPDGVLVLPKMKTYPTGAGTKLARTAENQTKNNRAALETYLKEQDQLRQRQRIEIYALNKIMTQLELNEFRNFCRESGRI